MTVTAQPIIEGASRDLGGDADVASRNPLPMLSHAPTLEFWNIAFFLHVGTLRLRALLSVQYVMG